MIEIARHLVFAEDLYLNRWILRNDAPWNPLGLKPAFLEHDAGYDGVPFDQAHDTGSAPTEDLEIVLAGLTAEELRRDTSDVDFGQRTVGNVLQGMARHDLECIREAEALLGELGRTG